MLLVVTVSCRAQDALLDSKVQVKQATIGLCLEFGAEPAAILRANRVYRDFQTRGFFRIGALPLLVIEELRIDVRDRSRLGAVLTNAAGHFLFRGAATKAVEARGFTLSFQSELDGCVRARLVRLEPGDSWGLKEGTVAGRGRDPVVNFQSATLRVAGPKTGELVCQTTNGYVRFDLLSLAITNQPNTHKSL